MITINNFTHRLGNQLFQIAAARSLAHLSGDRLGLKGWSYSKYFPNLEFYDYQNHEFPEWKEGGFHYTEIPTEAKTISGYFQSEKYFVKDIIKRDFSLCPNIVREVSSSYDFSNSAAIHIRRGDYLNWPNHHPVLDLSYFENAIKEFSARNLYILSDDPEWCEVKFKEGRVIKGQSDIYDLCIMTMVDNIAISNSTFSWWGAWLGKSKNVIAPKKWFGPAYENLNTKDIYCNGWNIR